MNTSFLTDYQRKILVLLELKYLVNTDIEYKLEISDSDELLIKKETGHTLVVKNEHMPVAFWNLSTKKYIDTSELPLNELIIMWLKSV